MQSTTEELQDSHYIKKNRSGQYPVWLSIATINFLLEILAPGIPHLSKSAHFNAIDLSTSKKPQYFTKVLARQQNYHYNSKITMQSVGTLYKSLGHFIATISTIPFLVSA